MIVTSEKILITMFKPLELVFRYFGINPKNNRWDKYFTILSISLELAIFVPELSVLPQMLTSLFGFLILIHNICSTTSYVGFVGMNFLYRHHYPTLLRELMRVENELMKIGAGPSPPVKIDIVIFFSFIVWVFVISVMHALNMAPLHKWSRSLRPILSSLPIMQHLVAVNQLDKMFYSLNHHLKQVSETSHDLLPTTVSSLLEEVFHVHTELHDRVSKVNTHYFFTNILCFISNMSAIVFSMYGYLQYVDGNNILELDFMVSTLFSQSIIFVVQAVVCHACAKKANTTVFLAHRVLCPDSPLTLWETVGDFSRLSLDNKVAFSVGGLLNLNRPLVTKAVVACLSYLIVAVQLQNVKLFQNFDVDMSNDTKFVTSSNFTY